MRRAARAVGRGITAVGRGIGHVFVGLLKNLDELFDAFT